MKKLCLLSSIILLSFSLITCEKDNDPVPETDLPSTTILLDGGALGLVIDTRKIAKKGYQPALATVNFPNTYDVFSQTVEISPSTNVATLNFLTEDLSEEQQEAFQEGLMLEIVIEDGASKELASLSDELKIDNSNTPVTIDTELPVIYPDLVLLEETPYLIQVISDDTDVANKLFRIRLDGSFEPGLDAIVIHDFDQANIDQFSFFFEAINDTLFHILMQPESSPEPFYLRMSPPGNFYSYYVTDPEAVDSDIYKFVVKRDDKGLVKIKPLSGNALDKRITSYDTQASNSTTEDGYLPLRIVAANITWEVEDRGTEFNPPIMPPAKLDFAYKSLLKNCSSATLSETVGKSESQTKSYTIGSEESLELYSSHEASVDVTAGVETETSFFGNGATASLEVSAGYTYTTSSTNTTTNIWEETVEETQEVSRVRDVELLPYTAVEVFDAIQSIENVRMPFVQILRIRGKYDGTDPLSGEDIVNQLLANQFGGTVSNVQDEYVEIAVRGTATINKFFEVESQVNELFGYCN